MHIDRTYVITVNYLNLKKAETLEVMRISRGSGFHILDNRELR